MKKFNDIPALPKSHQITWWVCRILLFIWGVWGMLHGYTSEFIQACFAIIFSHLWDMFQLWGGKSFITRVPYTFQTELNLFLCFACVIGTTINSRTDFTGIDLPEHAFAGFLAASGAFSLAEIMHGKKTPIKISVQAIFALSFGVTMLVGWEFYEFTMDRLYGFVMQHGQKPYAEGLTDTMIDLMVGSAGALLAMFLDSFRKAGLIGKNKKEVRAAFLKEREEYKALKAKLYAEGRQDEF